MPSATRIQRVLAYRRLYITALIILVADVLSKLWIIETLPFNTYHPSESIPVIDGFFYIVHIGNEGAAWGILSGYSTFLALFALVALAVIYRFRHTLELKRPILQLAFGMMIGGIIGNLRDRLAYGHVVDFLDFHFPFAIPFILEGGRYPAFNVADAGIVIGVFTYFILTFFPAKPTGAETAEVVDR